MPVRLSRPFRAPVASMRAGLMGLERERALFDLICAAGELAYRLPDTDVRLKCVAGSKDPRRRLAREARRLSPRSRARGSGLWARAERRLAQALEDALVARGDGDLQPLRVLLAYAPTALAPDCVVPREGLQRAAWDTLIRLFGHMHPTRVRRVAALPHVGEDLLARLRREAAPGLRRGRASSGRRPGPNGRALAVDPSLMVLVGKALGRRLKPGYKARYLYYVKPGDHLWPHADDPNYAVNFLLCLDKRLPPRAATGSALLAYRPGGKADRHELDAGCAVAMEAGVVHAREPLKAGERLVLLSILYA